MKAIKDYIREANKRYHPLRLLVAAPLSLTIAFLGLSLALITAVLRTVVSVLVNLSINISEWAYRKEDEQVSQD